MSPRRLAAQLLTRPGTGQRRRSTTLLLTALGNSWFATGPAVVLAVAGVDAPGSWGILVIARAPQFAGDFYAIDLALSTLGLAIAGVLGFFSKERQERLAPRAGTGPAPGVVQALLTVVAADAPAIQQPDRVAAGRTRAGAVVGADPILRSW